ncbi:unnamed protein product [Chondrus crispus]|uniref:TFIIS-type domain-containing protein n=1 Tax=Chondrus crispus TaxID=2769 RepID=R7QDA7_CHOCR|nr:unnamed protein product [Chondrus crispus]CDF35768.1 unnamed protein product [Chondrus crispus]|eukprot:XP_005715587.1 unnamed protein product [Chondrus crispus]
MHFTTGALTPLSSKRRHPNPTRATSRLYSVRAFPSPHPQAPIALAQPRAARNDPFPSPSRCARRKPPAKMPVKFCSNCNNMLYPRENTKELRRTGKKELIYSCRNCFAVQVIQVPNEAVYKNVVVHTAEEKMSITYDVSLDPTLPRTFSAKCPDCSGSEAVYFQSPVGKNDEALVLVFVCVTCSKQWLSSDE